MLARRDRTPFISQTVPRDSSLPPSFVAPQHPLPCMIVGICSLPHCSRDSGDWFSRSYIATKSHLPPHSYRALSSRFCFSSPPYCPSPHIIHIPSHKTFPFRLTVSASEASNPFAIHLQRIYVLRTSLTTRRPSSGPPFRLHEALAIPETDCRFTNALVSKAQIKIYDSSLRDQSAAPVLRFHNSVTRLEVAFSFLKISVTVFRVRCCWHQDLRPFHQRTLQ